MSTYQCVILAETLERVNFLESCLIATKEKVAPVFTSYFDEDPEEICLLYRPDIVIIDCDNDNINAFEHISAYETILPEVRIIALIDYMQLSFGTSIKNLQNIHFLPRPVTHSAVEECIQHIVSELKVIQDNIYSPASLNSLLNDNIPVIRQHYLSMIMRRPVSDTEDISEKFKTLKIDCPGPYYTVAVASIILNKHIEDFEAINFLLVTKIKSALIQKGYQCYIFFDSEFKINCIVGADTPQAEDAMEEVLNEIKMHFDKENMFRFVSGVGRTVTKASEIYRSFQEAEAASFSAAKENDIVLFRNINAIKRMDLVSEHSIQKIMKLYAIGDLEAYKNAVNAHILDLEQCGNIKMLKRFVAKYVLKAVDQSEQLEVNLLDIQTIPFIILRLYAAADIETVKECEKEFTKIMLSAKQGLRAQEENIYIIEQAVIFINEHLTDPALGLELVSSNVGVSKSYFCRLFHKLTGQSFSNYVRIQRVERAKELLVQSGLKTYEIAEATGFTAPKYFSSVFKQVTGMTPSEYQCGQKEN